jgi:hypothetical protein
MTPRSSPTVVYAIGDIHGRADLLQSLICKLELHVARTPGLKQLVYLGD